MRNSTSKLFLAALLWLAPALGCDANLGSVSSSETSDGGPGDGDGDGDPEPIACIGGELCPDGTGCANGLCVADCAGESDCASDEYCGGDALCHPDSVPTCGSDLDCAGSQTCVGQFCTTLGASGCDYTNYLQDGCPSNAVCLEELESDGVGVCHEMPACAADQTCPIGLEGAVCNTGHLVSKDEVCLIGMCESVEDCPSLWSCVRYNNSVLGACSSGGFGSPCSQPSHCASENCVLIPGLGGGVCG